MKVASKLALGWCLAVLPLVGLLVYLVSQVERLSTANRNLSAIQFHAALDSLRLIRGLDRLDEYASKFAVSRDSGYVAKFQEEQHAVLLQLASLRKMQLTKSEQDPSRCICFPLGAVSSGRDTVCGNRWSRKVGRAFDPSAQLEGPC